MTLIQRIEACKQMAIELKEVTPDVFSVDFCIKDQSIKDIEDAAKHYEAKLDGAHERLQFGLSEIGKYFISVRSVPCEITKTIEYKPKEIAA